MLSLFGDVIALYTFSVLLMIMDKVVQFWRDWFKKSEECRRWRRDPDLDLEDMFIFGFVKGWDEALKGGKK